MGYPLSSDQKALSDAIGELSRRHWTLDHRERAWFGDEAAESELKRALIDAGVLGLMAPETCGGMGQNLVDSAAALERFGYDLFPGWVAHHVVACCLLARHPELAAEAGQGKPLLRLLDADRHLPYPQQVEMVIAWGERGVELLSKLTLKDLESTDKNRPLARLVRAQRRHALEHAQGDAFGRRASELSLLADALQLLGMGQAALDMSVDYVSQRHQFGQPVGAQQAVKNQLADALIALEFARPMVQRAAYAWQEEEALTAGRVSGCWILVTEAAQRVERAALQVHGAMGYSIEYPLHQLLKRSWSLRAAHGRLSEHRAQAQEWLLGGNSE